METRAHTLSCINSCGIHQIGAIRLTGKKKKEDNAIYDDFEIFIDGEFEYGNTKLGKSLGDFKTCDIPKFIYELGEKVASRDLDFYTYYASNEDKVKELANKYDV